MIALSVGFGAGFSDLRALAQPAAPTQTAPASPQAIPTDTLSFADRLSRLELLHELPPTAADMPILDRLTRLEQKLLGQAGTGSIIERLKNLESLRAKGAAPVGAIPVGATPVTNSSAPLAVPAATAPPPPTQSSQGSMADFIKSAQVSKIVVLSDIYPPSFSRIQAASDTQPDKSDYLDAVLKESKNKVLKFQKMPVPVYITPIQEFGFNKAVREALDDWGARTNGLVSFVEVKNQKDARVVVIFSRLGLKPESDCSLGAHTVT
ncbi:MAG: hypothetical protein JSS86_03310, partial [Cyanobacteria bacterium SZAS LIN-2]|nr:hypothetical protein [Cyanobacteria bacterium SZAS LIN-2]